MSDNNEKEYGQREKPTVVRYSPRFNKVIKPAPYDPKELSEFEKKNLRRGLTKNGNKIKSTKRRKILTPTERARLNPVLWEPPHDLRKRRIGLGITQIQLARAVGSSQSAISKLENEGRDKDYRVSADMFNAIESYLENYGGHHSVELTLSGDEFEALSNKASEKKMSVESLIRSYLFS